MPNHLPPDEMLADYACGATSPGVSLLIAAHLTEAPESRRRVSEFEEIGGVLLTEQDEADMSASALDKTLAMLDAPLAEDTAPAKIGGPLPRPILDMMGHGFEEIPWKFRLPGVSSHELDAFGDEKVTLLRAKPGAKVPQHTHEGTELTLVMQGVLVDDGVSYGKGDVALNDEDDDHQPYIGGDEVCYCLIVQQGDLRFTGTFSRVLNYIGE